MKLTILFVLFIAAFSPFATTAQTTIPVTATLADLTGAAATSNTQFCLTLQDRAGHPPIAARVTGSKVLAVLRVCAKLTDSGVATLNIIPNDLITAGSITGGTKYLASVEQGGPANPIWQANYIFNSSDGSETFPPSFPSTYRRLFLRLRPRP